MRRPTAALLPSDRTHRLGARVRAAFAVAGVAITACTTAAVPVRPHDDRATQARIARIEAAIVSIDATGADSGAAQSLIARMAALKVPGLGVAVFDSGRIIWARSYGIADVSSGMAVDSTTLFQAASISKPVTSVGVFRLVERGLIALDEDVNVPLESWTLPDNQFTREEKVTPRRIVTHMAGLTVSGFAGYPRGEPIPTLQQILDGIPPANSRAVRVDTFPGARERYSGGGFVLLQMLMEDVSGVRFDSLIADLVLERAGMTHSTFALPLPPALEARAAAGHERSGSVVPGRYHLYPELAPAGLWSTPSDIARFMLAVGRSYRGEADGLLEPANARTMLTRVPGGSGQGFGLSGEGAAFRYRHSGGNAGFTCYAVAFAGIGRGMVAMTNSDAGTQLIRELTRAVAREYGWPRMWVRE